jgi:replicative DNA helicase
VLGGASNAGKTQLMLHLARRASEAELLPGVITMEVPKRGLQRRVYSNVTAFGYYDFLHHRWTDGDASAKANLLKGEIAKYRQSNGALRSLYVMERDSAPTLDEIMAGCSALYEAGSRAIFVDHLQLIKAPADQISDRATEISEALRWFAHSQKCLVVALSQLNRMASRERDRRPTMHDLWGGTAIESNANQVILLDHSRQQRDAMHSHLLKTWLYLDKNREGPNRVLIPVEANFKTGEWREADPDEVGRWPDA